MDESKFALSCVWCTEGLRLCADSIRSRMYPVRAGGTTGVAGMSAMPQRPGEAQGQTVPGVADGAHRLEARVAGDGGGPVRGSGVRPGLRGFPPFAPPYVWYTYRLQAFVESLWGMMTVTDLAVVTGLGWDTVKKIIKARLEKGYGHPRLKHIRRLSIDEIYFGRHKKFYTLVIDLDTGQIIWVAKGRGGDALRPFWRALRLSTAKIEAVAMDMSAGYWAAVMEHLPEAAIVFDRFHIIKLMNEKLDRLRREMVNEASGPMKQTVKGIRYLLLMRRENVEEEKLPRLDEALKHNEPLFTGYLLKEAPSAQRLFRLLYRERMVAQEPFQEDETCTGFIFLEGFLCNHSFSIQKSKKPLSRWCFLEQVASEQGFIVLERLIEARQFLLLHVLAAHQQQIPDPLHGLLHRAAGFVAHLSAQTIQFLVHQLDDVEAVEDDCRLGQVLHHGRPVTGTHVHGHGLNLRRAQAQGPPERAQRIPAAPLSNPDDLAGVEVNDQGVELFVAAKVNLVNGQAADVLQAGVAIALLQPGLNDFLDRIPSQARHHRQLRHCHHPPQAFDKGLEPVRVPDVGRGKRGETSKLWPHARHSHWGTSVTSHTRFKPMGTVCNSRNRLPLRFTWALWHRGHTSNSCRAASTNRIHPPPYTVRT